MNNHEVAAKKSVRILILSFFGLSLFFTTVFFALYLSSDASAVKISLKNEKKLPNSPQLDSVKTAELPMNQQPPLKKLDTIQVVDSLKTVAKKTTAQSKAVKKTAPVVKNKQPKIDWDREAEIAAQIAMAERNYERTVQKYGEEIKLRALRRGVDPDVVLATVLTESGGNPNVVSDSGCVGIMQNKPSTARVNCKLPVVQEQLRELGLVVPSDSAGFHAFLCNPKVGLILGIEHLKQSLELNGYSYPLSIIAFMGGDEAVIKRSRRCGGATNYFYYRMVYGAYKMVAEKKGEEVNDLLMRPAAAPLVRGAVASQNEFVSNNN